MLDHLDLSGHYVYALTYGEVILYVGKGSGPRLPRQMLAFRLAGHILETFRTARQAYKAEVRYIADLSPLLNRNRGGGGSGPKLRDPPPSKWERELEKLNDVWVARNYCARLVLHAQKYGYGHFDDPVDQLYCQLIATTPPHILRDVESSQHPETTCEFCE